MPILREGNAPRKENGFLICVTSVHVDYVSICTRLITHLHSTVHKEITNKPEKKLSSPFSESVSLNSKARFIHLITITVVLTKYLFVFVFYR